MALSEEGDEDATPGPVAKRVSTTECYELWNQESANLIFETDTADEMREQIRHQLEGGEEYRWVIRQGGLVRATADGHRETIAATEDEILAWLEAKR